MAERGADATKIKVGDVLIGIDHEYNGYGLTGPGSVSIATEVRNRYFIRVQLVDPLPDRNVQHIGRCYDVDPQYFKVAINNHSFLQFLKR